MTTGGLKRKDKRTLAEKCNESGVISAMSSINSQYTNRYFISLYLTLLLVIVSFSCAWQNNNEPMIGRRQDRCIGYLVQRLGSIMYLWNSFANWLYNFFVTSIVGTSLWSALAFGCTVTLFTLMILRLDRAVPDFAPQLPFLSEKIRSGTGRKDFQLSYMLAIMNGVTLGILSMGTF